MKRSLTGLILASSLALAVPSVFAFGGEHGNGDSGMGGSGGPSGGGGGMGSLESSYDAYGYPEESSDQSPEPSVSNSGGDVANDGSPLMERATQEESGTASAGATYGNRSTGARFGDGYNGNFTHHGDHVKDPVETTSLGRD